MVLAGVAGVGAVTGPVAGAEPLPSPRPAVATLTGAVATLTGEQQQVRRDAVRQVSRDQASRERASGQQVLAGEAPTGEVPAGQAGGGVVAAAEDAATADVVGPLAVPGSTPAFAQEDTAVVAEPAPRAAVLADVERGAQLALSGRTEDGFAEVVRNGVLAWVDDDLVGSKPPPKEIETVAGPVPADVSGAPCPGGSGVESGLTPNTVAVHRAVCAAFPDLVYGGVRPGDSGEHGRGQALDIMVTGSKGDAIAAFLQEHASELGVDNVIWKQRIWFAGNPKGAWKVMGDRGSITANHYDHVHVGTR